MGVTLALIDYDTGNLHSAQRGLEWAGAQVDILTQPEGLDRYDGLILPGDGAFDPALRHLREQGFEQPIRDSLQQGTPFLGICLGLQLLFEGSEEGVEPGLGILPGIVKRFKSEPGLTIPHMGWNQLQFTQPDCPLWQGLDNGTWVYFVHSYYGDPADSTWTAATVTHGSQEVAAAIGRDHIFATQFHPEKSGQLGLQMLKNFVDYVSYRRTSQRTLIAMR